jgi:hypothetical protein
MELISHTRLQPAASQTLSRQENHYNILKSKTNVPIEKWLHQKKNFQISKAEHAQKHCWAKCHWEKLKRLTCILWPSHIASIYLQDQPTKSHDWNSRNLNTITIWNLLPSNPLHPMLIYNPWTRLSNKPNHPATVTPNQTESLLVYVCKNISLNRDSLQRLFGMSLGRRPEILIWTGIRWDTSVSVIYLKHIQLIYAHKNAGSCM